MATAMRSAYKRTIILEQLKPIKHLYQKYLDNTISDIERKQLMRFFQSATDTEIDFVIGKLAEEENHPLQDLSRFDHRAQQIFARITEHTRPKTRKLFKWLPYAAAIVVLVGISIFIYNQKFTSNTPAQTAQVGEDIPAGTNRASLQLADGSTITLDDASLGELAQEQGVNITKTADGQLLYVISNDSENHEVLSGAKPVSDSEPAYNTITTPKGGQYTVKLPDGSTVYLNSASQLKYPARFTGAQRRVQLNGEAYFEVAKNAEQPFIVATATQEVEVLGTHFNINSYPNEGRTVTTLAEGSVRVSSLRGTKQSQTIKPGEQTLLDANSIKVQEADMETALAWKNGRIEYKDADLQTIMRNVARWYNIEVAYQGNIPERRFTASVPRSASLATLLKVLRISNINFEVQETPQGKKLIVKP